MPNGAAISAETAQALNAARAQGGRIVAVGTTSLRLLESAAAEDGMIEPFDGETSIFITPGYRFRAVDILLTNFHLPRSTLFMLVSAFSGLETMQARLCPRDRERATGSIPTAMPACCFARGLTRWGSPPPGRVVARTSGISKKPAGVAGQG